MLVKVLKLFWVGVSGATNNYPKQFQHFNYAYAWLITENYYFCKLIIVHAPK